jgi:flagellar basal-body rod protein FlgB
MSVIFDRLTSTLERSLDFRLERGNVIAANLANVDTPDYTPVELQFDEALARELSGDPGRDLARTDEGHLSVVPEPDEAPARAEFDTFALPNLDGNSVDLDHEMSKLSENQMLYRASTVFYNKRMALMKYAISEGSAG